MPLGFRKHIINAKNSQEELKVKTDSTERLNNFDRRLSARNLDKVVEKTDAVINRDFATIRPRGLPTDLMHKEGEYVYHRRVSIEQEDLEDGDEARLPPFAPFRTASDTDNLHLLPTATGKRAYLYLIDQETDIHQVKLQNADILYVDTQNAIRKRFDAKHKKKKHPKKKKKHKPPPEPEVPEEATEPPPEEQPPPPEEEKPEQDVPVEPETLEETPPQEDELPAPVEEEPPPAEEHSPSEIPNDPNNRKEGLPPEKPLPSVPSGKVARNSSRSSRRPKTTSSLPPGKIRPLPVSSSPTPRSRRPSQHSRSTPQRHSKPPRRSKKRSPSSSSSSSYSYSSSSSSSSSSGSGSDPDLMKLMLQMMMMENMGGMGGMGGGQSYPTPQYGQPPPPPYGQPPPHYGQPPPCPPKKKKKKNRRLNKPINVAKNNRGLNFDFLPEEDCCTEITVTIDPDEENPLECAMDNGVMPIVCCYVPPQLAQTGSPGFQCYQCQTPHGCFQKGDCGQNKTSANGGSASNSKKAKDSSLKEIVPPNPHGGSGSHSYTYVYPSDSKTNKKS